MMWFLGMGLRFSAANARSIVCPGLPGKSIENRAKTVSTALILPKPQLRWQQQPLSVSSVSGWMWRASIFPAAANFSNSCFIHFNSHPRESLTLLKLVSKNPRQISLRVLQARPDGDFTETLLDQALDQGTAVQPMKSIDRALCQELVYGVVRAQAALD